MFSSCEWDVQYEPQTPVKNCVRATMSLMFQSLRVSFYCLCRMCALVHDLFFHLFSILTETSYTHSLAGTRTTLHNTPQFGFVGNSFVNHILTCNDAVSFSSFESGRRWNR